MEAAEEDIQFLEMLNENIHYNEEGHLEMPLPFREHPQLPNNKQLAMFRLKRLKGKMDKNPKYKEDYIKFMNSVKTVMQMKQMAHQQVVTHGTYHTMACIISGSQKKFELLCSAKYEGTSLNDHLLTGPDLINALAGVLCRF